MGHGAHTDDGEADVEPVSAAMGAAAGTANKLSKNSLVQALLLPTAKAYGDHWGRETKERLAAAAAAKKANNLRTHLAAVQRPLGSDFAPDPSLADEWIDGAQNIDPVDEDLSTAWRAVLLAVGSGDLLRRRLLETVKLLSPEEAHAFMVIASGRIARDDALDHRRKLEQLGLLRRPLDVMTGRYGLSILLMVVLMATSGLVMSSGLPLAVSMGGRDIEVFRATGTSLALTAALVGVVAAYWLAYRPRLSELGRALAHLSQRVRDGGPTVDESNVAGEATEPTGDPNHSSERPKRRSRTSTSKRRQRDTGADAPLA